MGLSVSDEKIQLRLIVFSGFEFHLKAFDFVSVTLWSHHVPSLAFTMCYFKTKQTTVKFAALNFEPFLRIQRSQLHWFAHLSKMPQ